MAGGQKGAGGGRQWQEVSGVAGRQCSAGVAAVTGSGSGGENVAGSGKGGRGGGKQWQGGFCFHVKSFCFHLNTIIHV